jgi:hypothetical protein
MKPLCRIALVLCLVGVVSSRAAGQVKPTALSIGPGEVPKPSLSLRLLPDPREQIPGNAATIYYRTEAMFFENPALLKDIKESHWDEWLKAPLRDFPKDEVQKAVHMTRHLVKELEQASRYKDCDWQLGGRPEGAGLLLPEVQGYRRIGVVLAVHVRLAIAQKDWNGAIRALRIGYSLGKNLGQGQTLIHMLVGTAIVTQLNGQLEAMIQQPDAPNLYWALAVLPRPMFNPVPALLEESDWVERLWPALPKMDRGVMTLEEVDASLAVLRKQLDDFGVRRPNEAEKVAQSAMIVTAAPEARRWLIEQGRPAAQVEAMPHVQVVALYAWKQYRLAFEEWVKWPQVPDGIYHPGYKKARDQLRRSAELLDRLFISGLMRGLGFTGPVDLTRPMSAAKRVERRRAAYMVVEALRLHAARHAGQWPTSLDAITDVPVPNDPHTGKPFEYRLEEGRATLTASQRPDETNPAAMALTFELTLRSGK